MARFGEINFAPRPMFMPFRLPWVILYRPNKLQVCWAILSTGNIFLMIVLVPGWMYVRRGRPEESTWP